MAVEAESAKQQTEVGSYFVATYPPFSVWSADGGGARRHAGAARAGRAGRAARHVPAHPVLPQAVPLLLLPRLHRQERVTRSATTSTSWRANGSSAARLPAMAGRPLNFVYFGGGTPSFLSTRQLQGLVARLSAATPWSDAEEVTFECEPGTLTEAKLAVIRGIGVTRLSLGVENFSDDILELNGRAHRSPEVFRAYEFARTLGFPHDQHRPDRRHARRNRRELAVRASRRRWRSSRTASPSTRWSCPSTRRSAATC